MNRFNFFRRGETSADPESIRNTLFQTAQTGDARQLAELCRQHREIIQQHFRTWQKVPEAIRSNPQQLQHYGNGLIAVAQCFASELGQPELLQGMIGPPQTNPLIQWKEKIGQAQKLMSKAHYPKAIDLLVQLPEEARGLAGSGPDQFLPLTYGYLGESLFQSGRVAEAAEPFTTTLRLCEQKEDQEGVISHLGNLLETHRYLGQIDQAVSCAEKLAQAHRACGREDQGEHFRARAERMRQGEPLLRAIAQTEQGNVEIDDLARRGERKFQVVLERNRIQLRLATELTRQGGQLATQGNSEQALLLATTGSRRRRSGRYDALAAPGHPARGQSLRRCHGEGSTVLWYRRALLILAGT